MKHWSTFILGVLMAGLYIVPTNAQVETFGSDHGKPPPHWTKFDWPQMREILFGQFAPTEEEIALIERALPTRPTVQPALERRVLLFYRCLYPHTSIATGVHALQKMGESSGAYQVDTSDDPADFAPENLANYDAVVLLNTVGYEKILGAERCDALAAFVKAGNGLIGIHAAADACKGWPEGAEMMGGIFQCHPWLPKGTWAFQLESSTHPLNRCFGGAGFWMRDEIYAYHKGSHSRARSRVLVGLDLSQRHNLEAEDLHQGNKHLVTEEAYRPVVWVHAWGKGRVFYSNFGHNNSTYWHPVILQQMLDGIQFALGDLPADTTPSDDITATSIAPAPEAISR